MVLESARPAGVPVVHATGEGRPDVRLGSATLRAPAPGENELAGYDIVPSLAPVDGELVAHGGRASALFGTPVSTWL
jgi:maleamate amidohydrolase